mgnify:CR=1 FL=1
MIETRRPVVLVRSIEQYRRLQAEQPEAIAEARIVGLGTHLSLAAAVRQDHAEFLYYTDLVTARDYQAAMEEACQVSHSWFTDLAGPVAPADLLESVRLEVLQWLGEMFLTEQVIARLVERLNPGHLLMVGEPQGRVEVVVTYEAEKRGIPLTVLPGPAPAVTARPRRRASARAHVTPKTSRNRAVRSGRISATSSRSKRTVEPTKVPNGVCER